MIYQINLTDHAKLRMVQRGIHPEAVKACLDWGQLYSVGNNNTGHFLGDKAVRQALRYGIDISEFKNIAVILSDENWIVTVEHMRRPATHWRES